MWGKTWSMTILSHKVIKNQILIMKNCLRSLKEFSLLIFSFLWMCTNDFKHYA